MSIVVNTDPSLTVGENDLHESLISSWTALHNPIIFAMQRKDYLLDSSVVVSGSGTEAVFDLDVVDSTKYDTLAVGKYVYLYCTTFSGTFLVTNKSSLTLTVELDGTVADGTYTGTGGYCNMPYLLGYYCEVQIGTYADSIFTLIATARFTPFSDGSFNIDVSAWLRRGVIINDEFDYIDDSWMDATLGGGFKMKYRERFNDEASVPSYTDTGTFYFVNAAKQIHDTFGQNMGEYVTFNTAPPAYLAKFLTLFPKPVYFSGMPFDIAFIRSEDLDGLDLKFLTVSLDVNNVVMGLGVLTDIVEDAGVIRLNPEPQANSYSMKIKITENPVTYDFTEYKEITVSTKCDDFPVYLKWLNTLGGWSYWLFGFDHENSLLIDNGVTFEKDISDLATATERLEYLSKRAFPRLSIGATDISASNITGLQGIMYSTKVLMLTNPDTWLTDGPESTPLPKWKTVLVRPGTFSIGTARSGTVDVELVLDLPELFIQTQ